MPQTLAPAPAPAAAPPLPNPLREGLLQGRIPDPCVMLIFGAAGDLTWRKLVPALYSLAIQHRLPTGFAIVGCAREPLSDEQIREKFLKGVRAERKGEEVDERIWEDFARNIYYIPGTFEDPQVFQKLKAKTEEIDAERGTGGNRIYYLAVQPSAFGTIIEQLGKAGMVAQDGAKNWTRVIIEKPFGRDLDTARALNRKVQSVFSEDQVYRIDHYLGKETVQNIMVLRFANGIFEPVWNRRYIDHVQITGAESLGVEDRGWYYDEAGVLRDMLQNHLLQVMSIVAMEPPTSFHAKYVRDEKSKVLHALHPIPPGRVDDFAVRGQYTAGSIGGKPVGSYRKDLMTLTKPPLPPERAENSTTDTYAAIKVFVDNWRWAGVPFYLRSAKRMPKRVTEVAIQFKMPPLMLFGGGAGDQIEPNVLALRIQPDEGIALKFEAKVPGAGIQVRAVNMDFRYGGSFGVKQPEAYERLLLDCMLGDPTLYTRDDAVEAGWRLVMPVLNVWKTDPKIPFYAAGTWGPEEAETFIERDGRRWRRL